MGDYHTVIEGKTFKGSFSRFSGLRDDNAFGVGRNRESILIQSCFIDANGVAEGLKLSHSNNVTIRNTTVVGGYEDCVDIVEGSNIIFERCVFIADNTKHHFTIKSNSKNIKIIDCTFMESFKWVFDGALVDMGNWSDYDVKELPKTKGVSIINCKLVDIPWWKRILTRRLYAENAIIKNTNGFNLKVPNFIVKCFWRLRRWQSNA